MNIKNLIGLIDKAVDAARKPVNKLTAFMIYATAVQRPGMSKIETTANIIADNAPLGINTGQMPDGTDNVVNAFVENMVEKIVNDIQDNGVVECVIPAGSIVVEAMGANAGGPITAVGTNVMDAKGYGVVR